VGIYDTVGFLLYRVIYGSGTGSTRCGYGVGKPDPWVTHSKPYVPVQPCLPVHSQHQGTYVEVRILGVESPKR
jgi:hypothetical protein